ncbi:hypothetical protein KSP40_PGU014031 [Platanthera guangdongensis]|uniref:Ubiquitin-like protease family profile domain-containing protein n=1 Tax=Platanthera guangdongensis TaxID=2320717 RepID=A0ABR2MI60_9ASPA
MQVEDRLGQSEGQSPWPLSRCLLHASEGGHLPDFLSRFPLREMFPANSQSGFTPYVWATGEQAVSKHTKGASSVTSGGVRRVDRPSTWLHLTILAFFILKGGPEVRRASQSANSTVKDLLSSLAVSMQVYISFGSRRTLAQCGRLMARRGSLRTTVLGQRKNIMEDFSNGNPKHKVKNVPIRAKRKRLRCRCFSSRFSKKIESWQIDFRGWELLGGTPFGCIIKAIPKLYMNVEILEILLSSWDEDQCGFVIGGNIIPFTADDIALITGLPNRGDKVLRKNVGFNGDTNYGRRGRSLKGLEKSLDNAVQIFKSSPNSENDRCFVQLMILYLWGSVLFPTSRIVPAYLFYYVQNLEAIGNYNWADAIHSFLVKEIKKNNEGKRVADRYISGLCLAVNVWFFEHVDFSVDTSVDSRPSDPDVSYHIPQEIDDLELVSRDNECHMRSRIVGGSDDALRGDPSQAKNLENIESDIQGGYERTNERGRHAEEGNNRRKDIDSDIKHLAEDFNKQSERVSLLERKLVKLERLLVSKGWEIEEEIVDIDDLTEHKVGKGDEEVHDVKIDGKPCIESLTRFRREDVDILVNVDDYASPIKRKKEAKVEPLKYVGRELLTEKEREYLDAFCIKPMPKDEVVFFYWNIAIRRHSMVEYLRGGYTPEEIIDAYARILCESGEMSEDTVASFLYVPPMFLGLYRNKLGSYRTFLNSVDMKSLEKVKFLFLPCLVSTANHWLLLVCDMEKRKWAVYDSLYDPRHREPAKEQVRGFAGALPGVNHWHVAVYYWTLSSWRANLGNLPSDGCYQAEIQIMLLTEYLHQNHEFDIRSWGLEYRRIYPQQDPGSLDCGVFVMKFIENIIRPRTINFRGTDAQLFRPQIAYKILRHC